MSKNAGRMPANPGSPRKERIAPCHCPAYKFPHRPGSGSCALGEQAGIEIYTKARDAVFAHEILCGGCPHYSSRNWNPLCVVSHPGDCPKLRKFFVEEAQ